MRCCVDFCSNTSGSVSTPSGKKPEGVSFHGFPREARLRAAWLRALCIQDCQLPDSAVVCSQHFLHDDICETEGGARPCAGAVPSTVLVCMICFDTRSKMVLMRRNGLRETYEKLTGHSLSDRGNLKHTVCVMCAQRLRNFSRFRDKCLRARSVMTELIEIKKLIRIRYDFTIRHIKLVDRVIYQLRNDFVRTTIGPNHWDLYVQENYNGKAQVDLAEKQPTSKSKSERSEESLWVADGADISDDNLMSESKVDDEVSRKRAKSSVKEEKGDIQDPLKCESPTEHSGVQDTGSDGDCDTRERKAPTAASSDDNSPLITASRTRVSPPTMKHATRSALKRRANVSASARGNGAQKTKNDDKPARKTNKQKQLLICDTCQRGFKTKYNLISHLNTHTKEKLFSCSICNFESRYKRSLQKHMQIHSGKIYLCPICDYIGNTEGSLRNHVKIHTGESPFSCDICEYKCLSKATLAIHMRKHTGERPFSCEFCDFRASDKYKLRRHNIRKHSDEKDFSCGYKSKKTTLKVRVEKTFACKRCEFVAANKADLVAHVRTHPKDKPFSCPLCEYRCAEKRDYERHMKAHFR